MQFCKRPAFWSICPCFVAMAAYDARADWRWRDGNSRVRRYQRKSLSSSECESSCVILGVCSAGNVSHRRCTGAVALPCGSSGVSLNVRCGWSFCSSRSSRRAFRPCESSCVFSGLLSGRTPSHTEDSSAASHRRDWPRAPSGRWCCCSVCRRRGSISDPCGS